MKTTRVFLFASLAIIILYWVWRLSRIDTVIPSEFDALILQIVKTKAIMFTVIFVLLQLQQQGFDSLGLTAGEWKRQVVRGLLLGLGMFVLINVGLNSIFASVFPRDPDAGPGVMHFFKDPGNLIIWLLVGMIGGGLVEEAERIFVITRFEQWMGRGGVVIGVILSSVFFGIGHLYQGTGAAISTGISGLCFSLIYLHSRRGWEPVIAHAFSDVLAILAATWLMR